MPNSSSSIRIKKLSPLLINQLAAGEVVTRPAAVVKELLENAIDAGATAIEVRITQGGMGMIEVIDNGMGIHPDDMVMAITRHATSKVADVANLHGITTLGFRGEALAATAAVSRLTLISSHDDSGIGRQLQVAGVLDDTPTLIPVVHHRGTTINVKDLYFNVPARRGNLKSIATEFGYIETIVREVGLARADVALTLFHDNKKRLSLSANVANATDVANTNNHCHLPLSRLEQATGLPLDHALAVSIDISHLVQQPMSKDGNGVVGRAMITGWLWPLYEGYHGQTTLPKLIYVNGRLVKEALISNQLRQLAQSAQLAGIGYALYFDLPTDWLNINVHPSKQRIKISPLNNIMAHLSHAVQSMLKSTHITEKVSEYEIPRIKNNTVLSEAKPSIQPVNLPHKKPPAHSRQVNAPKQSYQPATHKPLAQVSTQPYVDEPLDQNSNTAYLVSESPAQPALPICLDIIRYLDSVATDTFIDSNTDTSTLPWLLFYSQYQCLLICAKDWQFLVSQLFASRIFGTYASQKNKISDSALEINQQLAMVNTQMSAQDSMIFVADLAELLNKNAIKSVDSHHLATLMVSSTP